MKAVKDRPIPDSRAKRGLLAIEGMEVTFGKGATQKEEEAALEHINELIRWWNLPWIEWRGQK